MFLGALPLDDGTVEFRVWAPNAERVEVRLLGADHPLEPSGGGTHEGRVEAADGADYLFLLDGAPFADPCSREQPEGLLGPSRIVDTRRFSIAPGPALRLEELVLYELHVGTFSEAG